MARQRFSDEDDDRDERPRDRDEDDAPRRRDRDDDYDDRPRRPLAKPGLATAAGVLWVIWGSLGGISAVLQLLDLVSNGGKVPGAAVAIMAAQFLFTAGGTTICLLGGVRTLSSSASSLRAFGLLSLIYSIVFVLAYTLLITLLASYAGAALGGGQGAASVGVLVFVISCGTLVVIMSGMILASIFAMSASKKYELWWQATKGRSRRDG